MTDPSPTSTDEPTLTEYAGKLNDAIERRLDDQALGAHVAYRVATLLHPQPVVFVDAHAEDDDSRRSSLRGYAVVFTDQVVAFIRFEKATDVAWITQGHAPDHSYDQVDVTIAARNRLSGLSMPADMNGGQSWQQAAIDHDRFSKRGNLVLEYQGLPQSLTLPFNKEAAADMGPLLEGLIRDLAG